MKKKLSQYVKPLSSNTGTLQTEGQTERIPIPISRVSILTHDGDHFSNLLTQLPFTGIMINGLQHAEQYVNARAPFFWQFCTLLTKCYAVSVILLFLKVIPCEQPSDCSLFPMFWKKRQMWCILQCAVANSNRQTAAKMTSDILHGIWNIEYLASHSFTGTGPTDRTALPTDIVNWVIGTMLWSLHYNYCVCVYACIWTRLLTQC